MVSNMFMSLIEKRRSVRKFQDRPIPEETLNTLIEAALRSPSSRSINPWEFVIVTDRSLLEQLSNAKPHGASFLKGAPLGIVVCADTTKSDVWVEDTSIAAIYLQLAAESLELGSCWIQIRKRMFDTQRSADRYIAEALGLPDHMAVEAIVAIGYPVGKKAPHSKNSLQFDKISYNRYGRRQ